MLDFYGGSVKPTYGWFTTYGNIKAAIRKKASNRLLRNSGLE